MLTKTKTGATTSLTFTCSLLGFFLSAACKLLIFENTNREKGPFKRSLKMLTLGLPTKPITNLSFKYRCEHAYLFLENYLIVSSKNVA